MDKEQYIVYLEKWQQFAWICFVLSLVVAVAIYLAYKISYWTAKSDKSKFDKASEYEIKRLMQVNYAIATGIFFFINTLKPETVELSPIWFGIRIFVGFCFATLHGYISTLVLKYYYPGRLNKKLTRLRYSPRINPKTGNKMKLLSEDEEDAYLDEGMQAEENAFSVDYDVWIDPASGETLIEKYKGHLNALECDRCGFQTLKLEKEHIVEEPSAFEDGSIEKEYKCTYCGRVKRKTMKLSKRLDRSGGRMVSDPVAKNKFVETVKVEIHSNDGDSKIYEFQNLQQAKNFLEEFDFEKLKEEQY